MAKLVTKFKYLKPNERQNIGGYAKYIATREGVEKIDESYKLAQSTIKQQQFIEKILRDFPDAKEMLEYEDFVKEPTVGNASEFITRALEDNACEVMQAKTYADYIATRPRAQRFGSHGLFTDDGITVKLNEVSNNLNQYDGNVWTVIISLRREDAQRLGYDTGVRWRDMLRTQTAALAKNFKIPMDKLKWYAAFHNESHHPHVHLMVFAEEGVTPYLSKQGVTNLRSSFAKDIFAQDLLCVYEQQTEHRDALKFESRKLMAEMIGKINSGTYDNPAVENMLVKLADRLSKTGGKKVYGYLKADVKAIVNRIVGELAADERITSLYNLWYDQKEEVLRTYTQELPKRIPMVDNPEFKSIKNTVIQEAMRIAAGAIAFDDAAAGPLPEPEDNGQTKDPIEPDMDTDLMLSKKEKRLLMWRYYNRAKELLDKEYESYDPHKAVEYLIESANMGCSVAKYRLGKMFLRGDEVIKNVDYALRWLEESVSEKNQYAEYLLGKTYLKGEDVEKDLPYAEDLLRRSSAQGNRYAKYTLGKNLLDGELFLQNIPEAIKLITESANSGFDSAQYLLGKLLYKGEVMPQDAKVAIIYLEKAAEQKNPYAAYLAGKILLTEESVKDVPRAIRNLELAVQNGNDFAGYQLGRIFLLNRDVPQDYDRAIAYLTAAARNGNPYAAQLLHSIKANRNWSAAMSAFRLLGQIGRAIQRRLDEEHKIKTGAIDRKLKRIIDEKKQAHGLKT